MRTGRCCDNTVTTWEWWLQGFGQQDTDELCAGHALLCFVIRCDLSLSHVAGECNVEADYLSRMNSPSQALDHAIESDFPNYNRVEISVKDVFGPWRDFMSGGPKCLGQDVVS